MNYYEALQVPVNADKERIKTNFRKLSLLYHPDVQKNASDVDYLMMIEAYKTLSDDQKRSDYDAQLTETERRIVSVVYEQEGYIIPYERIEYSLSIKNILRAGIRINKKFRHSDYSGFFGEDVTVSIKPLEVKIGAAAILDIPIREECTVCGGRDVTCYRCEGLGYVKAMRKIRFSIPSNCLDGQVFEVDLNEVFHSERNKAISFYLKIRKIRIRVVFID